MKKTTFETLCFLAFDLWNVVETVIVTAFVVCAFGSALIGFVFNMPNALLVTLITCAACPVVAVVANVITEYIQSYATEVYFMIKEQTKE